MSQTWIAPSAPGAPYKTSVGYWQNNTWNATGPGTFAVVVGASRYPNMRRGSNSFGFDEGLYVSATTAFAFYRWLTAESGFAWPDAPPARTWLLLAPTDAELAFDSQLANMPCADPTFINFKAALTEWYTALKTLPKHIAAQSCGILFFSGHGVSYGNSGQLMLPSDWPNPREADPRNWAPRSGFLLDGLSVLNVANVLFFIDACWDNGGQRIGNFKADGIPIFPQPADDERKNPDQRRPVIYAATAGRQTLQPTDPRIGYSIFGEALLAALQMPGGTPAQEGQCTPDLCPVEFPDLVRDVKRRVQTLLRDKAKLPDEPSSVTDGGSGVSLAYATWHRRAESISRPPQPPLPPTEDALLSMVHTAEWRAGETYDALHDLVGHESITWPLMALRFYDPASPIQRQTDFTIAAARTNESLSRVRCDVELDPGLGTGPVWTVLADPYLPQTAWATAFPIGALAPYSLSYRLDSTGVATVQFNVSTRSPGKLGHVAERWNIARDVSTADSLTGLDVEELVMSARLKKADRADVLAAEISASLLVTAGGFDALSPAWLRQLWQNHESPNSAVLYAHRLIMNGGKRAREADDVLASLRELGLPTIKQIFDLLNTIALRKAHRQEPLSIEPWLAAVRPFVQPEGMLSAFSGPIGRLGPWISKFTTWTDAMLARYALDEYLSPPPAIISTRTGPATGIRVPSWLVHTNDYSPIAAFQSLAAKANYTGTVSGVTQEELATAAHVSPDTMQRGLRKLADYGVVGIENDPAERTKLYQLRDAPPPMSLENW